LNLLVLLASSDDYLLSEAVDDEVRRLSAALEGAEVEILPDGVSPGELAAEVQSPSLFSPRRVLVSSDAGPWIEPPAKGSGGRADSGPVGVDVAPLVEALQGGLPEDVALVLGACCRAKPKGELVEVVAQSGEVRWMPLPPRPKPWEEVALSGEEEAVLLRVLERKTGSERWQPAARRLLLERLGFAPRLVAQEAVKLATAAGPDGVVDEELVRRLVFPRERSLEVVRDAVLKREIGPILDLLGAHAEGLPVLDWRGRPVEPKGVVVVLLGQVTSLLVQMLYLRRLAASLGLEAELSPSRTERQYWYGSTFKKKLADALLEGIAADDTSPFSSQRRGVSPWTLGLLFAGAARWDEARLLSAVATAGEAEAATRGSLDVEALTAWLAAAFSGSL
jgi:hypothetical protein